MTKVQDVIVFDRLAAKDGVLSFQFASQKEVDPLVKELSARSNLCSNLDAEEAKRWHRKPSAALNLRLTRMLRN